MDGETTAAGAAAVLLRINVSERVTVIKMAVEDKPLLRYTVSSWKGLSLFVWFGRWSYPWASNLRFGGVVIHGAHSTFHSLSTVNYLGIVFNLSPFRWGIPVRIGTCGDTQTHWGCRFGDFACFTSARCLLRGLALLLVFVIVSVRVLMLVLKALLRHKGLFPRVASCSGFVYLKLLRSSGNNGRSITPRSFCLTRSIDPILWVGPMRSATPFCFFAELVLEVGPNIINTRQVFGEGLIRSRYDVVFLFERYEHFLDLDCGVEEQFSPWQITWIKDGRGRGPVERARGWVDAQRVATGAVLGAHRCRGGRNTAGAIASASWFGRV